MKTIIEILIGTIVISIPITAIIIYLRSLEIKVKNTVVKYKNHNSIELFDLNVWVKNFDILNKSKAFDSDIYSTTYDYYICDLIINSDSIMVIGKSKFLGIKKHLNPTIFSKVGEKFNFHGITNRIVETIAIRLENSTIKLDFKDPNYSNEMTLVIKNIASDDIYKIEDALIKDEVKTDAKI